MSLTPLLSPRSIAVIGASDNPKRIGGMPVDLLKRAGFRNVYPVNPKSDVIQGLAAYKAIEDVPEKVDLAILAVSADLVLDQLNRCHALGIPAGLVFASGYAETNEPDGIARQAALAEFAAKSGMKVAGPNCMGNANFTDQIFTTFGPSFQPGEPAGSTALLTQSGNMCATLFQMAKRTGVTFSQIINTGNEAAVDFSDYLDHLSGDPSTKAAVCYIEQLRDGAKFLAAAKKFRAAGKLLTVFKVGSSEKGAAAAASHTAALAGDNSAYDAAFEQAGVARVTELAGLSDLAYLHGFGSRIGGANCAVLSISGAAGAILADALELAGGDTPTLPQSVQDALSAQIPGHSMVSNPVDLTGNIVNSNAFLTDCINLALSAEEIDVLLLYTPGSFLTGAYEQIKHAAAANSKAIVVIDTYASADRVALAADGIIYFDDFDRAARGIVAYGKWKLADSATVENKRSDLAWPALPEDRSALSETEGKEALQRFGVPVVQDALVNTESAAREAAGRVGYPLVAKLVSPDVAHKTEHGLIRLNLQDEEEVADAFTSMMAKAKAMNVQIDGVTMEPMLQGGIEILAGVTRDPVFGWMLTVGMGGIWTELLKDVQHRLLPVDAAAAEEMLRKLKSFKLLDGYRNAPRADVTAAADAIAALCRAVIAGGDRLHEVEVNPLLVLPEGSGAVALDALVLLAEPAPSQLEEIA